jgi:hypothetical protein
MHTLSIRIRSATTIPHPGFSCARIADALVPSPILSRGILSRVISAYLPNKSIPASAHSAVPISMRRHCGSPNPSYTPRNSTLKATF